MDKIFNIRRRLVSSRTRGEAGQVLVIGLIVVIALSLVSISVANIGMMVAEKIAVQDATDAAAYSAAVTEARFMNLSAYLNRAMAANYNSMAFNTAVWATVDSFEHGLAPMMVLLYIICDILFVIPYTTSAAVKIDNNIVDNIAKYGHKPLHEFNVILNDLFAQDETDLNKYLEIYNTDILSTYQGLLYAAEQAARYRVASEVAKKVDPEVSTTTVIGLGAEVVSSDQLAEAVDFVIRDPGARIAGISTVNAAVNRFAGTDENTNDHPLLLGAISEASLDRFSAGRNRQGNANLLRQFSLGNMLAMASGGIDLLNIACEIATAGFGDCDYHANIIAGAFMEDGWENKASEDHVPFLARRRMREVNFFGLGLDIDLPGLGAIADFLNIRLGHTSGDEMADVSNHGNLYDTNFERTLQCFLAGGCQTSQLNVIVGALYGMIPPIAVDDHWDGSVSGLRPVDGYSIIPGFPEHGPAGLAEYAPQMYGNLEEGVPRYDWRTDLDNVGFFHYHYPDSGAQARASGNTRGSGSMVGPSVGVVGVKKQEDINGLHGLGMGNEYPITAVSRAQVYYLRNPNRAAETASTLNPHWVARLAPLDSDDTPIMLRKGIPFAASAGVVGIDPLGIDVDFNIPFVGGVSFDPSITPTH